MFLYFETAKIELAMAVTLCLAARQCKDPVRVQPDGNPGQSAANLTHNLCHLMSWKTDNCKPCCT